MTENHVEFLCGPLSLEGVWHLPEGEGVFPAVIVCHPHPLYGGSMDVGIVVALCRQLARRNINAFRFNFRGVGGSQGAYDEGIGEQDDLVAAISYVQSALFVDKDRAGICGYSFGAGVVLSTAPRVNHVRAMAVVSPPLTPDSRYHPARFTGPKLFLGGSEDTLFSSRELSRFVEALPQQREYEIVQGADHFWMGHESEAVGKVAGFFQKVFLGE